ncbi:urease accessory protein UreF [Echinicola strongylocentroti]|uniref:Urease accessory protein UreF n=1 Tax=Echinicola strongylocentroti TaxID=1795355 RepID=A0A2Z4ICH7_9BACT|nr:urease accessory protein UreF [Echinicola strongylocentroti]AWW28661.1 urease accessory protein UreF [Echinicola strongylocentroti]
MINDNGNIPSSLLNLLHLADPTLPIGGFSHSNGLETYVQQGIVCNVPTTAAFIQSMLKNNYKFNDCLMLRYAFEMTKTEDMEALVELDEEVSALKAPREIKEASQKLGLRLLKIYINLLKNPFLESYYEKVQQKAAPGNFPLVYGQLTALMGADIRSSITSFYYNAAVSMVTNAVKLVPLGQIDGQKILYQLHPKIHSLTEETLQLERRFLGVCNPALDIKCMQHERLYSRLYMS